MLFQINPWEEKFTMTCRTKVVYIFWSCQDKTEAKKIVCELLSKKLIACASIFPEIESIYYWAGKIEENKEVKVLLKTVSKHFDAIQKLIQTQCSYEVPEIVQVNIAQGNPSYLSWVGSETSLHGKL